MIRTAWLLFASVAALAASPVSARDNAGLHVDRVVLLMRHGVRPPTKDPAMPAGVAAQAWPAWPVKPGYLTPHGAAAITLLAAADRADWLGNGVLPRTCTPGAVRIVADSDERTIATARAYAAGLTPGCTVAIEHRPQDAPDPLFSPIEEGAAPLDPARADAAVQAAAGPGGIAAAEAAVRPVLTRLDAILCGGATTACGIADDSSGISPAGARKRPKLSGALDRGSTAGQILLLEYAEGKPAAEVGWGRATAADIAQASALHALEFRLLARPRYIAVHNMAGIAPLIRSALADPSPTAPRVTMISGHDTNVASLGGLLDAHWHVPGVAADDPAPGGALVMERLSDRAGQHYVRVSYRSQTLEQLRHLTPPGTAQPYRTALSLPGCRARGVAGLCTLAAFDALLAADERGR